MKEKDQNQGHLLIILDQEAEIEIIREDQESLDPGLKK